MTSDAFVRLFGCRRDLSDVLREYASDFRAKIVKRANRAFADYAATTLRRDGARNHANDVLDAIADVRTWNERHPDDRIVMHEYVDPTAVVVFAALAGTEGRTR